MILLLFAMLAGQDGDAAESFRVFEQTLAKAETLVLKFKGHQEVTVKGAAPVSFECSGELLLKGANKARYLLRVGQQEILMASDGTTLEIGAAGATRRREAPADLRARFLDPSAARVGLVGLLAIPTGYAGREVEDRREAFTCSDFKTLESEGSLKRIRYTVKASPSGRLYETTLGLDSTDGLPRRRIVVGLDAGSKSVVTESYEPWGLGSELEDKAFTLPSSK